MHSLSLSELKTIKLDKIQNKNKNLYSLKYYLNDCLVSQNYLIFSLKKFIVYIKFRMFCIKSLTARKLCPCAEQSKPCRKEFRCRNCANIKFVSKRSWRCIVGRCKDQHEKKQNVPALGDLLNVPQNVGAKIVRTNLGFAKA